MQVTRFEKNKLKCFQPSLIIPILQFDDWSLIKRCSVDNIYRKVLHFRSSIYPSCTGRSKSSVQTTVSRRRRRAESSNFTADSDGRSSAMSNTTEVFDVDGYFNTDFDFDGRSYFTSIRSFRYISTEYCHLILVMWTVTQYQYESISYEVHLVMLQIVQYQCLNILIEDYFGKARPTFTSKLAISSIH